MPWSYKSLCVAFRGETIKNELAPWRGEVVTDSYQAGLEALGKALQNYSAARKAGRHVGFPRFRAKGRSHEAVIFQRPRLADSRHVVLDRRLGPLRTRESMRKLIRLLDADPRARVLRSTVQRVSGGWVISFTVQRSAKQRRPNAAIGVDLGLPANYHPDGRAKKGCTWVSSQRMIRTEQRIARLHERVANLRREQAHQLTTTFVREFGVIGVETLAVKNLLANRRLARHIADVGWGVILAQLSYKTSWSHSSLLVAADRFYPSSKTCSACGAVKAKLRLADRVFTCDADCCRARSGPRRQRGPEPRPHGEPARAGGGHLVVRGPHRTVHANCARRAGQPGRSRPAQPREARRPLGVIRARQRAGSRGLLAGRIFAH
ncbi:MAG: RNA-guided endonuclease InsQ/TnpB family protein [Solirubrobacteraceae bacterium]